MNPPYTTTRRLATTNAKISQAPAVDRASHVTFKCGMYAEDVQSPADMERGTPGSSIMGALFS